ncbi:TPA: bifunctional hydroxymethylpyrimidine kinase/phosphomethylpyrimidine kinase, partial [Citrobacter braakii]|nr:bifunctional hydroxymethylpyrimidine kinase/phosphomethylpyrimidine kinase [Citrobacter braakii]
LFDGSTHQQFPAYPAVNIDTSGAGDAFNGALAARLACGENIANAIHYACVFAALAVEREGAANMPSHELVLKRLTCNKY